MTFAATTESRVSTSVAAYARASAALADTRVRLAANERILRIGDDAASITAAAGLQAETATLRGSLASGARAGSYLQTAAQGLSQIHDVLTDLAALATQASASGITPHGATYLHAQFQSALTGIDRIVAATTFNRNRSRTQHPESPGGSARRQNPGGKGPGRRRSPSRPLPKALRSARSRRT